MAMEVRRISRATAPHLPTLADDLRSLLAVANAGSFHLRYQDGGVVIEQNSFSGVNVSAVEAAVAAAPDASEVLDVKAELKALPLLTKAIVLSLIDAINTERAQHGRAAITQTQAVNAIIAKVDEIA